MTTIFSAQHCSALAATSLALLVAACGSDETTNISGGGPTKNDAAPELIPGGGVGSGAIKGKLNVYAIDADTRAPLEGADVRVGESDDQSPLVGKTDATGLATFESDKLSGPATITITAAGHAAATWFGANGANVTIPVDPTANAMPETASATGTIEGWDAMPVPAMNHVTVAFVGYSWTSKLGDRANDIQQPKGMMGTPDPNTCIRIGAQVTPCAWKLVTRTGKQAHYAILLDVDTKGTLMDRTDDTYAVVGFAFKTGLDLAAGQTSANESLTMFPAASIVDLDLTAPMGPTGLDEVVAIPLLDTGADGKIPFFLGQVGVKLRVPQATDIFAGASYEVLARASTGVMGAQYPSSLSITRGIDVTNPVTLPTFQATPADLAASGGTYSFRAVNGATLHSGAFVGASGERAWTFAILDGRESFGLPALSPDPLPAGMGTMIVNAITAAGVTVTDFDMDDAQGKLTGLSDNGVGYTH